MPYEYNLGNLQGTAILGSTFTQHLQAIQAQKLLVILDCCHADGQAIRQREKMERRRDRIFKAIPFS